MKGIGVSSGIGLAKALVWKPKISFDFIPRVSDEPEQEIKRYFSAHDILAEKISLGRQKTALRYSENEALIFDAYLMMLNDDENLKDPIVKSIKDNKLSAEYAVAGQFTKLAKQLESLDNDYMSQRSDDVINLRDQLLVEIIGTQIEDISHLDHPTILVTHMISPADMADFDFSRLEGIICETGGYSSHAAIIARTLGIPAIFGAKNITHIAKNNVFLAMDGETGEIWLEPERREIGVLSQRRKDIILEREQLKIYRGAPTITKDRHRLELSANIAKIEDLDAAVDADAESIGLFRTELILRGDVPANEDKQFEIYKNALEKMNGKSVTFRTYDDGALNNSMVNGRAEENPSLGFRGIRLCLSRPSFFRTQLRALLRASAYGNLKIVFPMISSIDEQIDAMAALDNIKKELSREGVPYDEKLQVGILVETPAAALMADTLAKRADFLAIGVNDLLQFTLAVDRFNPALEYIYNYYHPPFLKLMKHVIDAAHKNKTTCSLCGELPGQGKALPLLLGLEPDSFSINSNLVLPTRQILNNCSYKECKKLASEILKMETSADVIKHISAEQGI